MYTGCTPFPTGWRSGSEGKAGTGLRPWRWLLIENISEGKSICRSYQDFTKRFFQLLSGEQLKEDQCANMSIKIAATKISLQSNFKMLNLGTEVSKPQEQKLLWFTLCVALLSNISLQEKVTHLRNRVVLSAEFSGRSIRFRKWWVSCKVGDQDCELTKTRQSQDLTYPGTANLAWDIAASLTSSEYHEIPCSIKTHEQ